MKSGVDGCQTGGIIPCVEPNKLETLARAAAEPSMHFFLLDRTNVLHAGLGPNSLKPPGTPVWKSPVGS